MTERPNVLLVTVDSLRADHVYGDTPDTPSFDRLREESVTYPDAFSQGAHTTFSMPSLFCSQYPRDLQYVTFSESTDGVAMYDERNIVETFQNAGYETAGFHSNPLLTLLDFERGFDTCSAQLGRLDTDAIPDRIELVVDKLLRLIRKHAYVPAHELNERAIEWLEARDSDRPFFLWLHYMDVHGPYQAKSGNVYLNKFRGERLWQKAVHRPEQVTDAEHERLLDLYRAEVEYTDEQFGRFVDALERLGVYDETVTVLTADHGEQFGERGLYSHPEQVYSELTNVPLLYRDTEAGAGRIDDLVGLVDLAPTLTHRALGERPDQFRGQVLPHYAAQSGMDATVVSEAAFDPAYVGALRTEEWTLIERGGEDDPQLFHRASDPGERNDVAEEHSEERAKLARRLEDVRTTGGEAEQVATDEVEDRLKTLGYLE